MYKNCLYNMITKRRQMHPLSSPKWVSAIINTTNNDVINDQKKLINYIKPVSILSGQSPCSKKAKTSVSAFNIRKGQTLGTLTVLHKKNFINFLTILNVFLLSKLQNWDTKKENMFNYSLIYNIGMPELKLWPLGFINLNTGAFIQLTIKQKQKSDLLIFFLSYYSLKYKKA